MSIYAFLVGIDKYSGGVSNLQGCENDITSFAEYLKVRCNTPTDNIKLLKSEQATRDNVIAGFREHLQRAKKGDTALFYYSGHGAQERANKAFWGLEPDRLNETLVCHDSRTLGSHDLADKELNALIKEVADKDVHVAVILDCCHSGSGTRDDEMVRKVPVDERKRPLDSYCFSTARATEINSSMFDAKHILLSACNDNELAKEHSAEGKYWGAFSYFLRKTLENSKGALSYYELLQRARARVTSSKRDQTPQLEEHNIDKNSAFLDGAVLKSPENYLVKYDDNQWLLDAGSVHGLVANTHLAIFEDSITDLDNLSKAFAKATIEKPDVTSCSLKITKIKDDLDIEKQYKAVVTQLPLEPMLISFEGDKEGVNKAREYLGRSNGGNPSLYLQEAENPEYRLIAKNNEYFIARPDDHRPIVEQITGGYTDHTAQKAIEALEHIDRWHKTEELQNPDSDIDEDAVELVIGYNNQQYINEAPVLYYTEQGESWNRPEITLELRLNKAQQKQLYCALVSLDEQFGVSVFPLPSNRLELGYEPIKANNGKSFGMIVPDEVFKRGVTERRDIFKLIISTKEFDPFLLEQKDLGHPQERERTTRGTGMLSTLEALFERTQTRGSPWDFGDANHNDDWITKSVVVTTIRPQEGVEISSQQNRNLLQEVKLGKHSQLKAKVSLSSTKESKRNLERAIQAVEKIEDKPKESLVPAVLREDIDYTDYYCEDVSYRYSEPYNFTTSRSADPGLSVLKLDDIQNSQEVTPDNPLILTVETPLADNEQILPYTTDGEFFFPLGFAKTDGDTTQIIINELPKIEQIQEMQKRGLGDSLRIYFHKVFNPRYNYPLLRVATVDNDGNVEYEKHTTEEIKTKVANAQRIILFVHGIIADTKNMVGSVARATITENGENKLLRDAYDLVLTFDYENLNTTIDKNAGLLKKRLKEIGLKANHDKTLHVVAHSMGGLVSRWFIEREDGDKVVSHLVMLGTPNGGSPWANVKDNVFQTIRGWAYTNLTLILSGFMASPLAPAAVASLMKILGSIDNSLDNMNKESKFLAKLNESNDPKVPYTIIAGATDELEKVLLDQEQGLLKRLFNRLKIAVFDVLTEKLFKKPNDIAVSVQSIRNVDANRNPQPVKHDVDSDHLSYFNLPKSYNLLAQTLQDNLGD